MSFDKKDYPPTWEALRKAVLHRAQNKCELCDAENRKPHWKTDSKVVLTIHHIDRNKKNNNEHN